MKVLKKTRNRATEARLRYRSRAGAVENCASRRSVETRNHSIEGRPAMISSLRDPLRDAKKRSARGGEIIAPAKGGGSLCDNGAPAPPSGCPLRGAQGDG